MAVAEEREGVPQGCKSRPVWEKGSISPLSLPLSLSLYKSVK
jgi:hypothetical protein